MSANPSAILPNPKTAAITANTRKIKNERLLQYGIPPGF